MANRRAVGIGIAVVAALLLAIAFAWGERPAANEIDTDDAEADVAPRSHDLGRRDSRPASKGDPFGAPTAAITGTVRDPQRTPIPNAQVCARSNTWERRGIDDRTPHCVRTGPDGRYAIDGLLPISTTVDASAPTFKQGAWQRRERGRTRSSIPLRAGQTANDIDITLEPGGVLVRGVIKDIAGGEIEGAIVVLGGGWRTNIVGSALTISGPDGAFEGWVAPGTINVSAAADGYAGGAVEAVAPGEFVELFMTPESVLVGEVVLAGTGEPVEGVEVDAGGQFGSGDQVRTDAAGRFRIDRLQPGSYKPTAKHEALYGEAKQQVHLGLGETSERVVIEVHPASLVEGRVVVAGQQDRPCTDGWVLLESAAANRESAAVDDEGYVQIRGVVAGTYSVTVRCEGHVAEPTYPDLIVGAGELDEQRWEVRAGLAIRGEVVDEAGEPVANIRVRAAPVVDGQAAREQATSAGGESETDGSFELAGLLPGRYEIGPANWGGRPSPTEPVVVELEAGADVNDVRVVMPAIGSVRGRVVDERGQPVSGISLVATHVGGQERSSGRSNDAGEFEITDLRPGSVRVVAGTSMWGGGTTLRKPGLTDDDVQGEVVEVIANETVEVTLTVESRDGRITGVVTDEGGGPVADAFIDVERMSDAAGANAAAARRSVRWSFGHEPVLTDADGRFELAELPEGKFIVRANRKGGGEAIAEDVALGSHVALVIASTGEIAGTVRFADQTAPARFEISIYDRALGISVRDSFFQTDGVWRLTEVPAGNYELEATASEGTVELDAPLALGEGEVREGVELILSGRVSVRGRVIDLDTLEPVAGIEIYVGGGRRFGSSADKDRRNISGGDGRFELEGVPVGKIELIAWTRAGGSKAKHDQFRRVMTIAAEPAVQDVGDLEVVARRIEPSASVGDLGFTLNRWDPSLELEDWKPVVATVRPGGPAALAGLAAADVIAKLDGHDVQGIHASRYRTLSTVPAGTTLRLELEGGKTVEITAAAPAL